MTGLKPSGIAAGLIAAMAATGVWALLHVNGNAAVPIHFDLSGTPNGFAPAWLALLLLPASGVLIWLLPMVLARIDPRGENVLRSGRAVDTIRLATTVVLALVQVMTVCAAMGIRIDTTHIVGIMVGGLFIAIGNVFGKLRWNYTIGIRTPWTLANERVWDQTHRFGGRVFVLGGAPVAGLSLLLPPGVMEPALTALIILIVALPIVKSYALWVQVKQ